MAAAAPLFFIGTEINRGQYARMIDHVGMEWFDPQKDHPERLATAAAVVVDLPLRTVPEATAARKALAQLGKTVPRLFVVDREERVEVVHAGAIGANALSSRPLAARDLMRFLGQHGAMPVARPLPTKPTPGTETEALQSIRSAAGTLQQLFDAIADGRAPDHVRVYAACDEVATAIGHDGVAAWLDTVRAHHQGTMQHCLIVAGVLTRFGQSAGMSDTDVRMLTRIGLLHDVGKAVIPTELLDKPGKLTDAEFAVIKTHPYQGFKFLAKHGGVSQDKLSAVVGHHEYLDGSGYPYALTGKSIGEVVRITTICDIYGALVEPRAYKAEMAPMDALAVLDRMTAEGKLDEALVRVLRKSVLV